MLKIKQNNINNLILRLRELQKQSAQIGYFAESGIHPSGLSFANLYAIHAFSAPSVNIPRRDPLGDTFEIWEPLNKDIKLKMDLKTYFSNIKSKTPRIKAQQIMENLMGRYVVKVRDVFGDTGKLESNSAFTQWLKELAGVNPPNNPLVWTSSLKNNLSYKINGQPLTTP